ncbi:hypothetical protein [Lutispora thermophila]|uniref:Uncharacterized protein n=1 Tax=Lutispora thermophila DSM 19022 TaxID=1122184 RepID=A0A1M6GWX4_9FIRM|nr:hypothetical protein [Lutispora thermophila]SHJ14355.1 hypothetical protein SAMN02745176_02554 [Lutispora thermophila DSM 19022]
MANTNFENFLEQIWDKKIDLSEADFNLKTLTAILYLGRYQINRGDDRITFNFHQIRELLNLDDSVPINQQIKKAIFQLYFKPFKYYKLIGNCSWYLRVIRGIMKSSDDTEFKKEWAVIIDSVLLEHILQSYFKKILIPNQFFLNYHLLSDEAIKLYFSMKLQEQLAGNKEWRIDEIMEFASICKSTFYRSIKYLIQFDLVKKHAGNRRRYEKATYSINKNHTANKGYTPFSASVINNMLYNTTKKLKNGEIKLYSYLCYLAGGIGEIRKSPAEIGLLIGKEPNLISKLADILHEKDYIIKETYIGEDNQSCCRYII